MASFSSSSYCLSFWNDEKRLKPDVWPQLKAKHGTQIRTRSGINFYAYLTSMWGSDYSDMCCSWSKFWRPGLPDGLLTLSDPKPSRHSSRTVSWGLPALWSDCYQYLILLSNLTRCGQRRTQPRLGSKASLSSVEIPGDLGNDSTGRVIILCWSVKEPRDCLSASVSKCVSWLIRSFLLGSAAICAVLDRKPWETLAKLRNNCE